MKTKIYKLIIAIASVCLFSGCQEKFDYPLESLSGYWDGTHIYVNNSWTDITYWEHLQKFAFSIKFNDNGTYQSYGYFGNGSGTYKTDGSVIKLYVDKKYYRTITIVSLTDNNAEAVMSVEGASEKLGVKMQKR